MQLGARDMASNPVAFASDTWPDFCSRKLASLDTQVFLTLIAAYSEAEKSWGPRGGRWDGDLGILLRSRK